MKRVILSIVSVFLIVAAYAQIPGTLSYQGILVDGTGAPVADGTHFVKFDFYSVASGGSALYSSTGVGSGNSVTTFKGMFTFIIGSGTAGNLAIPTNIWDGQVYVEVTADLVVLTPRIQLTTNAYSFKAQTANAVVDNAITSAKINDGTIVAADLATDAVISAKILDGTIAAGDLGTGSVTSAKILDGDIVNADISASAAIADTKLATISTAGKVSGNAITSGTISGSLIGTGISATNVTTGTLPAGVLPASVASGSGASGQIGFWNGTSTLTGDAGNFWDNTNKRLGLGTNAPSRRLHLVGTGGLDDDIVLESNAAGANGGIIRFTRSQGTFATPTSALAGDQLGSVTFAGHTGTAYTNGAEIFSNAETLFSTGVNSYLGFSTASSGVLSEKMRLSSKGNLSLGGAPYSTVPRAHFYNYSGVAGLNEVLRLTGGGSAFGDGPVLNFQSAQAGSTVTTYQDWIGAAIGSPYPSVSYGGDLTFYTNNGSVTSGPIAISSLERMRINNIGSVGIGTSAPTNRLHVVGDGSTELTDDFGLEGNGSTTPIFSLIKTGGTFTSPTATPVGDIGQFAFEGNTGAGYTSAGLIKGVAETAFGSGVNGALAFVTASSGSLFERMRITSAGNVGLGTTAVANKLDVEGGLAVGVNYSGTSVAPSSGAIIEGNVAIGTTTTSNKLHVYGSNDPLIRLDGPAGSQAVLDFSTAGTRKWSFYVPSGGADFNIYNAQNGANVIGFKGATGNIELAGNGTGNVGIGVFGPTNKLHVVGNTTGDLTHFVNQSVAGGTALQSEVITTATATGTRYGLYSLAWYGQSANYGVYGYGYGGTAAYGVYGTAGGATTNYAGYFGGDLHVTGNITYVGTITDVSDRKLKKDIKPLEGALQRIMKLEPSTYLFKADEYKFLSLSKEKQFGLIAQDVEKVFPEMVREIKLPKEQDRDGKTLHEDFDYKGIDYTQLITPMIKAMQEQQTQIEDLKSTITDLKSQLNQYKDLSAQVEDLKKLMAEREVAPAKSSSVSGGNKK